VEHNYPGDDERGSKIENQAIGLGGFSMVVGAIVTPFLPPLGIVFLVGGGVSVAIGVGIKLYDAYKAWRARKAEAAARNSNQIAPMINLQQAFRNEVTPTSTVSGQPTVLVAPIPSRPSLRLRTNQSTGTSEERQRLTMG